MPTRPLTNCHRKSCLFHQDACEISEWKSGLYLDTLATAYAAAGDFENAVKFSEQALQKDDARDNAKIKARLELFRAKKPFVR